MRIGLLGPAPHWPTGYGVQIKYLLRVLPALGHQVASFAFTGLHGSPIVVDGVTVYPKLFHVSGQDMGMHARHFGADLVIPVMDIWNLDIPAWDDIPLAPWFPVDHTPLSPGIALRLEQAFQPIVYSQWGQQVCKAAGYEVSYIPCMVDTATYAPHPREEARAALEWPQDRFIVGIVAANISAPSRKAFWQQLRAFALFHGEHPDALLYLHTFANAGHETDGENLLAMCEQLGLRIGADVIFCDQYQYMLGFPPSHL